VHVPQARNQEFARPVDYNCVFSNADPIALSDFRDAIAGDDDRHVGVCRASGGVDHGDVGNDEWRVILIAAADRCGN